MRWRCDGKANVDASSAELLVRISWCRSITCHAGIWRSNCADQAAAGAFIATGNDQQGAIDVATFNATYPMCRRQALDMKRLQRSTSLLPLFQQPIRASATPMATSTTAWSDHRQPAGRAGYHDDIALVRPNVMYSLPTPNSGPIGGQKLMLRMALQRRNHQGQAARTARQSRPRARYRSHAAHRHARGSSSRPLRRPFSRFEVNTDGQHPALGPSRVG